MATFKDINSKVWKVEFDGILLHELRETHKIDLSDVVSSVYTQLKRDPSSLILALSFICADQIKDVKLSEREFSKLIVKKALDDAFKAVMEAAENFFPPSLWSVLSSRFTQEQKVAEYWARLKPTLDMFNRSEMPTEVKEFVFGEIAKMLPTGFSSQLQTREMLSAAGLDATQPTAASNSPDSAESTQEG